MKTYIAMFAVAAAAMSTTACSRTEAPGSSQPTLVQDKVCEVRAWAADAAAACQPGQKIVFLPNEWGNEQLPLLFVALNCDMRYSVAMTNGGAVCIHAKHAADKAR